MEKKEILVADKITKIYGIGTKTLYEALHEVSLTMYEGEFVCILGLVNRPSLITFQPLIFLQKEKFLLMVKKYVLCQKGKLVSLDMKI